MKRINAIRIVIAGIAAAAVLYGISRGEPLIVLQKAVMVCLECMGIG